MKKIFAAALGTLGALALTGCCCGCDPVYKRPDCSGCATPAAGSAPSYAAPAPAPAMPKPAGGQMACGAGKCG
jgi:hypothetical protein